jgi:hypothetical protein
MTTNSENIFDKAVLLTVEFHKLGTKRKVSTKQIEVDADKSMLHVSKDILESDKLKAIVRFDADTKRFIKYRSLPSKFMSGTYLLPISLIEDTEKILRERSAQREELVSGFMLEYQEKKSEGLQRLAALAREKDYPLEDKVRACFGMEWSYTEMSTPGRLKSISIALFEQEKQKAQATWNNAIADGQQILRDSFAGFVDQMTSILTPSDEGGKKRIKLPEDKRTWYADFQDFMANFSSLDMAGDAELAQLVETARKATNGIMPKQLKTDEAIRDSLKKTMDSLKNQMAPLMVDCKRAIDLTDDSEENNGTEDLF